MIEAQAERRIRRLRACTLVAAVVFFLLLCPLFTSLGWMAPRDLNQLGRYLCFALVAIGVDLIWGYTGVMSMCQALFFCLGAYVMGMHLSLGEGGGDVRPEYNDIPQFFFFNNVEQLPLFWEPMRSLPLTLLLVVLVPALVAGLLGWSIFRSRVRGVYVAIITQALAWGAFIAFSNNKLLLGGTNGLTGFHQGLTTESGWIIGLYFASLLLLAGGLGLCFWLTRTRFGRLLVAVRDNESRLRFAGYDPARFKLAAFVLAAVLAGLGGMLYVCQMGIITPNRMRVSEHIMMLIWVAVGGRGHLWGAVLGALVVNYSYTVLTSDVPALWPFVQGALFIVVVRGFPDGLIGLWFRAEERLRAGQGYAGSLLVAAPLLLLCAWVLTEMLGWMPAFLQAKPRFGFLPEHLALPWKMWLLLVLAVLLPLLDRLRMRQGLLPAQPKEALS